MYATVSDRRDGSSKPGHSPFLSSSLTHPHRSIGYHNQPQSLTESVRLVFERVPVFDTTVVSTLSPLPSPLDRTFRRSTIHSTLKPFHHPGHSTKEQTGFWSDLGYGDCLVSGFVVTVVCCSIIKFDMMMMIYYHSKFDVVQSNRPYNLKEIMIKK